MDPRKQKRLHFDFSCFDARNIDARNFDARNFDARNIDARNFDARNWTKLTPGRWDKRGPYVRPTSHPDLQSHTSPHHHHNNLRIFRVNNSEEYLRSTIS